MFYLCCYVLLKYENIFVFKFRMLYVLTRWSRRWHTSPLPPPCDFDQATLSRPTGAVTCRIGQTCRLWFGPISSMTSSTKPEVHNVLYCCERRTEKRPRVTFAENLVKFGRVVFKIRERTERHLTSQFTPPTRGKVATVSEITEWILKHWPSIY